MSATTIQTAWRILTITQDASRIRYSAFVKMVISRHLTIRTVRRCQNIWRIAQKTFSVLHLWVWVANARIIAVNATTSTSLRKRNQQRMANWRLYVHRWLNVANIVDIRKIATNDSWTMNPISPWIAFMVNVIANWVLWPLMMETVSQAEQEECHYGEALYSSSWWCSWKFVNIFL